MHDERQPDPDAGVFRLLAVVVLYKQKANESATLNTLRVALSNLRDTKAEVTVLVYDNTPGGQDPSPLPSNFSFKKDPENGGLAKAYNYAVKTACEKRIDWLLTLDQDTNLPPDFIDNVLQAIDFVEPLRQVAAIVPWISDGARVISPKIFVSRWGLTKKLREGFIGIPSEEASAVNSAAILRVSAVTTIGGYDPRFYLHSSDVVLFHRLHLHGFKIFVAGNIRVKHEMSVFDLKSRSTPHRFEENLRSEEAFYDEFLGWLGSLVLILRLVQRLTYRLWWTGGSLPYFKITLQSLYRRLLFSRKHRIQIWQQWLIREARNR